MKKGQSPELMVILFIAVIIALIVAINITVSKIGCGEWIVSQHRYTNKRNISNVSCNELRDSILLEIGVKHYDEYQYFCKSKEEWRVINNVILVNKFTLDEERDEYSRKCLRKWNN